MGMMKRKNNVLVCAPVECESGSVEETVEMMERAKEEGADLVELSLHSAAAAAAADQLLHHLTHQPLLPPAIISCRLKSSRRNGGCKTTCMQVLKRALDFDVEFVEMDYELASDIEMAEHIYNRSKSKVIVSSYVNGGKFSTERLGNLIALMQSTGADVIKLDLDVDYITDLAPAFSVLAHCQVPLIVMAVGSRGLISQLLSPKFGGFLVYGHISERPVPGLPSLVSIKRVYKLEYVNAETKVFGLISNPVGHSKGPILHNPAFRHTGYNGIYVPMLVDDIKEFFRTFNCVDFAGFSVGIPHKEAAVQCCDEVHHLAKLIGAVNTIIRRPVDGKLIGYNTDCEASMSAIEDALRERSAMHNGTSNTSPILGKRFVLIGAGGAGRALAFGARSRGARVVIFNRNYERAKALSDAVCGEALPYECLENFRPEKGMILANASAIGMDPNSHETPIPKEALKAYDLVFDAVYTPKNTRLLKEAAEVGAVVVSGVEMFIRQALGQFRLFTDGLAPEDFMRKIVLEQF